MRFAPNGRSAYASALGIAAVATLATAAFLPAQGGSGISVIPPGRYEVTLRAVGFTPTTETIEIKANAVTDDDRASPCIGV